VRPRQALFNRCRYRNRFGGTYTTYETDRTNESAAKIARDVVAEAEGKSGLGPVLTGPG
jgi:hypothetical protein